MTRDELAAKIFHETFGFGRQKDFGFRREGLNVYRWDTDHYALEIIVKSPRLAFLRATFKASNSLSMVRRYTYIGERLENESIRV